MRFLYLLFLSVVVLTANAQLPVTSGNVLWLKADAAVYNDGGVTAATNGQTVQQWNDQSGNGNNVTQATAGNRPVFQTAAMGAQPAIFFDGAAGTKYLNNTISNLVTAGGARTTFIVSKINTASAIGGTIFTFRRTTAINSLSLGLNAGANYIYTDGVTGANNASTATNIFSIAKSPFIVTYSSTSGSKIDYRFNTVSQIVSQAGAVSTESGTTGFTVGGREDVASWWQGLISEIIVYNRALTLSETIQIEAYLQTKYGITCSSTASTKSGSGNALLMPGTGSYGAYTPASTDFDFGNSDFGIECWLNPGGTGQDNCIMTRSVGAAATAGTSAFYFGFNYGAASSLSLAFYTTTGTGWTNVIYTPNNALTLSKWQHVAVVRKAGITKMYINGIEQTTTGTVVANIPAASQPLEIGAQNFTPYLGAVLDEVRIYKGGAPDQTVLRDWMCKKTTASHPYFANMVANYNFDENVGTNFAIDKMNCHTLYLYGNAAYLTSAAAIGDVSTHTYGGSTVTLADGDNFTANNFTGVTGMQVYKVKEKPNTLAVAGFTEIKDSANYYGTFPIGATPTYDATYDYTSNAINGTAYEANLIFAARNNNSTTPWVRKNTVTNTTTNTIKASLTDRSEYLPAVTNYPSRPGSGNAIRLNGSNQYVNIPDDNSLDFGNGNFTVQCWVKKNALTSGSNNVEIINKWTDGTATGEWWLGSTTGSDNIPSFYWQVGGTYSFINATTTLALNKWYNLSVTRVGPTVSLYVNGVLEATGNIGTNTINNVTGRNLLMGARNAFSGNYSAIDIDEVQIYKGSGLSQTTIRDWMCKKLTPLHPDYANLVSYYRFDEGSGTTLLDLKGSNDGTLINTPTWVASGAALGDVSAYNYAGNTSTANINFGTTGADNLAATLNAGTAAGIHVYGVNERANTMSGVDSLSVNNRYGGVYVVGGNPSAAYDAVYSYGANPTAAGYNADTLGLYKRIDGAATWSTATAQTNNITTKKITAAGQNTEYVLGLKIAVPVAPTCYSTFSTNGDLLNLTNQTHSYSLLDNNVDNFTYEFWANPTQPLGAGGTSGDRYIIFPVQTNSVGRTGIGIGVAVGTNGIRIYGHTAGYLVTQLGYTYTFTGWAHIAVVYTAQLPSIYVNGLLVATGTANGTARASDLYMQSNQYSQYFGSTTDFRLWNYARTAVQIAQNLNTPPVGNSAGLQTMIEFNNLYNGSGQLIKNSCTNLPLLSLDKITAGTTNTPAFNCNGNNFPPQVAPNCAAKFNGTNSRVDVGNLGAMPNKGTIEFWMNQPSFSDYQIMVSTIPINSTSQDGIYFETYATGQLLVAFGNNTTVGATNLSYSSYGNLVANRTYHVSVTWDLTAGNYKGYLDGRLIFVQPLTYYPTTLPRLTLGAGYNNGRYYNGTLDEVRYWNVERTQTELLSNANTITGTEAGLQAYYHFNENLLNGNGQTVLNKCTATGASLNGTTVNYVKFPCSLAPPTCGIKMSNIADKVRVPYNTALSLTQFTVAAWVKVPSASNAGYQTVVCKQYDAGNQNYTLYIHNNKAEITFQKAPIATGSGQVATGTTNLNDNEWHYIAGTFDGANLKIYVDGVLETNTASTFTPLTSNLDFSIGAWPTGDNPLTGNIDEVSVWNIARTQTDIQNNMTTNVVGNESGLVAYYNFNDNNRSGQNRTVTNFCTATGVTLNGLTYGTSLTPLFECAPPPFTTPECNMQLNSATDYVQAPHNAALSLSQFSAGAYFKTSNTGAIKNIIFKDVNGTYLFSNYQLSVSSTNKAQISFTNTLGATVTAIGVTTVTDGSWHYAVGTYDGINLKIYVDGVLDGTTANATTPITGTNPLDIGTDNGALNSFNGSLDEISVWNIALSLAQIQSFIGQRLVGNEVGLVAYYNFAGNAKNGQGITIINSCTATGAALNAITAGTTTTPIFTCSEMPVTPPTCSLLMNGVNDKVYVTRAGGITYPTVTNNFTMEVKAKALYTKGSASGAQIDGVFSGQNFLLFPDQGGGGFAPGHAGVGISMGTNGVAVYEHSSYYMPARIAFNNYNTNDWMHITVVSTNGVLKLYINGALVSTVGASGYVLHPSGDMGGYWGNAFAGYVGEVRVWNASLTGDQIRTNLNATLTGAESNLISLYKFGNNTLNGKNKSITGLGSFGSVNPYITAGTDCTPIFTCANTTAVNKDAAPGSGNMISQNGTALSFAEIGDVGNTPAQGSMMTWFNANTLKEKAFVFSTSHFRNSKGGYKGINLFTRADGKLQMTFGTDTTVTGFQDTALVANIIQPNRWYHFAMSWDTVAKTYTTYINGIQTATGSTNYWPIKMESFKAGIGLQPTTTSAWNGKIDELSMWNKILSLTEIRDQLARKINTAQANYANLTHYYRFDNNTCGGNAISDYKGTVHGMVYNTSLPTSSAPIGDTSRYDYSGVTSSTSVPFGLVGKDTISATITAGTNVQAVHVYGINEKPNTQNGQVILAGNDRYGGVFVAADTNQLNYNLKYSYNVNPHLPPSYIHDQLLLYKRTHNADATWVLDVTASVDSIAKTYNTTGRNSEYMLGYSLVPVRPHLGPDTTFYFVCADSTRRIDTVYKTAGFATYWSTPTPQTAPLGTHTLIATSSFGFSDTAIVFIKQKINVWTGIISNDWHVAANWDLNHVPDSTYHVVIPFGTPNPCQISNADASAASVQAKSMSNFAIINNRKLLIAAKCGALPVWP
jgi:Concanavalin A-like lectin/glucanases superfamily